jgi:hypothetical protein
MNLPAGFQAIGVGRGALCIVCHNTRNGLHEDPFTPTSYTAPHTSAQGDVLMGRNAYFVTPGARAPHSLITDTCVTCHLRLTPPPADLSYAGAGTNHAFRASRAICAECHGAFDGDALPEVFASELAALAGQIAGAVAERVNSEPTIHLRAWDPATDAFSSLSSPGANVFVDFTGGAPDCGVGLNQVLSVDVAEVHGQMAFGLGLACDVTFSLTTGASVTTNQVWVQLVSLQDAASVAFYPPDSNMVRAIWNYLLLQADGSAGAHNPGFSFEVISATRARPL